MYLTLKAVLARCNGDVQEAINYCQGIAAQYPRLRTEYEIIVNELVTARAAAAGVQ